MSKIRSIIIETTKDLDHTKTKVILEDGTQLKGITNIQINFDPKGSSVEITGYVLNANGNPIQLKEFTDNKYFKDKFAMYKQIYDVANIKII